MVVVSSGCFNILFWGEGEVAESLLSVVYDIMK